MRKVLKCPTCGTTMEVTVRNQEEFEKIETKCESCNDTLKEDSSKTLIEDFVEKAEEMDTDIEFISSETEEGMQLLKAFGGVAAFLRYHVG